MKRVVSIIAALGTNRAIGKNGQLLWQIPEDLKRFKQLTSGHPVIMGRKTWESLPEKFRPLPGRTNIVVTRDGSYAATGALVFTSLSDALAAAEREPGSEGIFIIGGGEIYAAGLPYADRLYLTLIDGNTDGDTFFPPYEEEFTKEIAREESESNGTRFTWLDLERS